MPINETFYGFVESTTDALLLFEASHRGILPKISRRLQEKERGIIRSGSIFIFDEKESGIKRWTDGRVWSPSRILSNFLIYRELDGRETLHQRQQFDKNNSPYYFTRPSDNEELLLSNEEKIKDRNLLGSLTDTYKFLRNGLIKKTISIQIEGRSHHLVSYYSKSDVLSGRLNTPSTSSELASLEISPGLILGQSFRVPPSAEFAESILRGPTLSPPVSISTLATYSSSRRASDHSLLPNPQYSGYEEQHSCRDYSQRTPHGTDSRMANRKSIDSNDFCMPPLSTVIPNYHQGRERNNYFSFTPPNYTFNKELNHREFPNPELMTENNVYEPLSRPHIQYPKPIQKYAPSLPSPSSLIWPTSTETTFRETKPPARQSQNDPFF